MGFDLPIPNINHIEFLPSEDNSAHGFSLPTLYQKMEVKQFLIKAERIKLKVKEITPDSIIFFRLYKYSFIHTDLLDPRYVEKIKNTYHCSICGDKMGYRGYTHFLKKHKNHKLIKECATKDIELQDEINSLRKILYPLHTKYVQFELNLDFGFKKSTIKNNKKLIKLEKEVNELNDKIYEIKVLKKENKLNLRKLIEKRSVVTDVVKQGYTWDTIDVDLEKYRLFVSGVGWSLEVLCNDIATTDELMECRTRVELMELVKINKKNLYKTLVDFEKKVEQVYDEYLGTPKEKCLYQQSDKRKDYLKNYRQSDKYKEYQKEYYLKHSKERRNLHESLE